MICSYIENFMQDKFTRIKSSVIEHDTTHYTLIKKYNKFEKKIEYKWHFLSKKERATSYKLLLQVFKIW